MENEETIEEVKKRVDSKFYYELFVDNNVWAGIHVIIELLDGDKNTELFAEKYNEGVNSKRFLFEVFNSDFHLSIQLCQFGLVYNLDMPDIGRTAYEVDFENDVIGLDLENEDLEKYEKLIDKAWSFIKNDRSSINTSFNMIID